MSDETEGETPDDNTPEGSGADENAASEGVQASAEGKAGDESAAGNVNLNELEDNEDKKDLDETIQKTAHDLEAVFDVPVSISAVLGRTHMEVSELLHLESGDVIELDRKVGEAIDIYVNNRLIARGEVVLLEEKLGITMTEIIKTERH